MISDVYEYLRSLDSSNKPFTLIESSTYSFTLNSRHISLVIRNISTNEYYDWHTIISVAIHEFAHVIDGSHSHSHSFECVRKHLCSKAQELYGYRPMYPIDPTYPHFL